MENADHKLDEARELYPNADEATLIRIAVAAGKKAEEAQAEGIEEGYSFSAEQAEYGCDWSWGDGITTRDDAGNVVVDEDDEPTARVFDCDGNTIELITDTEAL